MPYVLETPRLALRRMDYDDLDFLAALLADPEVMRFYPQVYSREEARGWIEKNLARYEEYGYGAWLALLKATGEPIGRIALMRQQVAGVEEDEIGYMIARAYWRQGLAHEGAAAVRDYAFGPLHKTRVISLVRPVNIPSQRTALSLGMKPEKLVTHYDLEHLVFARASHASTPFTTSPATSVRRR